MVSAIIAQMPGALLNEPSPAKVLEFLRRKLEKHVDDYTNYLEQTIDTNDSALKRIVDDWHSGKRYYPESGYKEQIQRLEEGIQDLAKKFVVVKTSRQTIIGHLVDNELWEGLSQDRSWNYINQHVGQFTVSYNQQRTLFYPRDIESPGNFLSDVLRCYGSLDDYGRGWCVISGQYFERRLMRGAHIVRHNVGEVQARYLFGDLLQDRGHIMGPRNGLPMHFSYEILLDEARIAFTPVPEKRDSWKIIVLDESLRRETTNKWGKVPWGADLDGLELKFPKDVDLRPRASYLYFNFCANILWRQRYEAKGWWRNILNNYDKTVWVRFGTNYLRKSTLRKLALRFGHLNRDEIEPFVEKIWIDSGGSAQPDPGVSWEDRDRVFACCVLSAAREEIEPRLV
ncbi:hypothetical protein F5Y13DRAFT_192919 [Hypoxylon sp. FL1857]|nr:hypothetical protein F5Y13DRAFT_192919 [Hypoxylon sp. FL1857]